jgi:hypothetical protein
MGGRFGSDETISKVGCAKVFPVLSLPIIRHFPTPSGIKAERPPRIAVPPHRGGDLPMTQKTPAWEELGGDKLQ